jgi:hypothetical protein
MREFLLTALSGWLALTVFAATLIVPLGVRALRIGGRQRRRFMTLHFALGIAVPALGLAHAAIPLRAAGMYGLKVQGLVFATGALLLLFVQAGLGIALREDVAARPIVRSAHLATMLAVATLIALHILRK